MKKNRKQHLLLAVLLVVVIGVVCGGIRGRRLLCDSARHGRRAGRKALDETDHDSHYLRRWRLSCLCADLHLFYVLLT